MGLHEAAFRRYYQAAEAISRDPASYFLACHVAGNPSSNDAKRGREPVNEFACNEKQDSFIARSVSDQTDNPASDALLRSLDY